MTYEIEQRKTSPPTKAEWEAFSQVANTISSTEFVPKSLRNKPEAIMACVLSGRELGLGPMQALQSIDVIDGKPSPSAELQRALVLEAGHKIWIEEADNTHAKVCGERTDTGITDCATWTLDDAAQAGLCQVKDGKAHARSRQGQPLPWERYTRAMLIARATSELASRLFPDVLSGLAKYTPDELTDGQQVAEEDVDNTFEPDEPPEEPVIEAEVVRDEDNGTEEGAHIEGADETAASPAAPSDPEEDPPSTHTSEDEPPPSGVGESASSLGDGEPEADPPDSPSPSPPSKTLTDEVTTEEERKKALSAIFAKAGEAGMSKDRVKAQAYARFGVSSMNDIPIEGLRSFYRDLARMVKNLQQESEPEAEEATTS